MSSSREPTLSALLDQALRHHTDGLRVAMPGRIQSFDAATQTADIEPLQRSTDIVDGTEIYSTLGVLPSVPVAFPGGGGFASTFPVTKGDPCWVVFGDWSLDEWFEQGSLVTPIDLQVHGLNGAVAFLGTRAQPQALSEFDTSRAVMGNKGPRIAFDGSTVHLGVGHNESGTQSAIRGEAHLQALLNYLDAVVGILNTVTSSPTGGPLLWIKGAEAGLATTTLIAAKAAYQAASHTTPKVKVP